MAARLFAIGIIVGLVVMAVREILLAIATTTAPIF